jgi:hypothetical protein
MGSYCSSGLEVGALPLPLSWACWVQERGTNKQGVFIVENWQLMFKGCASSPAWEIRTGKNFKEALEGELVCSFPSTTTKTAELTGRRARMAAASPYLVEAYGKLHDILSDCIESGRLTEADLPDDYKAIVEQLAGPCLDAMARVEGGV